MIGDYQSQSAPDHGQALIGYRVWKIYRGELLSPYQATPWPEDGTPASCAAGGHLRDISAPGKQCRCGFYSYKSMLSLGSQPAAVYSVNDLHHPTTTVKGAIKIWGRVEEHEIGYRSQYAAIHCLFKVDGSAIITARRRRRAVQMALATMGGAAMGLPMAQKKLSGEPLKSLAMAAATWAILRTAMATQRRADRSLAASIERFNCQVEVLARAHGVQALTPEQFQTFQGPQEDTNPEMAFPAVAGRIAVAQLREKYFSDRFGT